MSTVIKIGDRVTWRPRERDDRKNPLPFSNCKVLVLLDIDGRPGAILDCGFFGDVRAFVDDLEPMGKPDSTILSGG